jgi:hypothetical protein
MIGLHGIRICDITSPPSDEFHKEWTWVCLNTIDETHAPSMPFDRFLTGSQVRRSFTSYPC